MILVIRSNMSERWKPAENLNKTKLTLLVMKIQSWVNVHRVGFLKIVFGFIICLFALNIINLIRYYKARQNVPHRTAVEQVDQALRQQCELKKAR